MGYHPTTALSGSSPGLPKPEVLHGGVGARDGVPISGSRCSVPVYFGLGRCFRASYAANYFVVSSGLRVLLISLMKKPALEALKNTQESQESLRKTDYVGKRNRRATHTETQNAAFNCLIYEKRSNRLHSEPQYKQLREASLNLTLRGMINTVITQADERPRLCLIGRGERNMKKKLKKKL